MYKVYADNQLIYHSKLESMPIFEATAELEQNKTGSFDFKVLSSHPRFHLLNRMKPIITVYQSDYLMFRGRILEERIGWHNEKELHCEGDLAFLLDSILRPFAFSGTPAEFLAYVLELHNAQVDASKRFAVGNVTVEGYLTHDTEEYTTTKETLEKALLDPFGGFFQTRFQDGQAYIDYLATSTLLAPQTIEFGKNLITLERIRKGADIATVIIPLGEKLKDEEGNDTGKRLTIESVNDGVDFIQDDAAVAQFGIIVKSVIFDGVTDAETLKAEGQAYLANSVKLPDTIELTAADLAAAGVDITSFHLNTMVRVISKPHGIDQLFMVTKLSINLFDPAANKLTLGGVIQGFSGAVQGLANQQQQILQTVEQSATRASEAIYNVEQNLLASMQVTADNIQSVVAENYYLKEDTDALVSSVSTEIEQTKNSVEIQFAQFSRDVESVANDVDAEFQEIHKYIRFEDGNIIQSAEGGRFEKVQTATKESYYEDGAEVGYWSNRKFHAQDGEFLHGLQLGGFAWLHRTNGHLSFKKVT